MDEVNTTQKRAMAIDPSWVNQTVTSIARALRRGGALEAEISYCWYSGGERMLYPLITWLPGTSVLISGIHAAFGDVDFYAREEQEGAVASNVYNGTLQDALVWFVEDLVAQHGTQALAKSDQPGTVLLRVTASEEASLRYFTEFVADTVWTYAAHGPNPANPGAS